MKANSILKNLADRLKNKQSISKKNFISFAEAACILSLTKDKKIWKPYQVFWQKSNEHQRYIIINQIINAIEVLTISIEKNERNWQEKIFDFQVKSSLFKKLHSKKPVTNHLLFEYESLLERAYRTNKSAKFQNFAEELMIEIPLPKKEWVDAIIYAVSQPYISKDPNLTKLTLSNQNAKIQLAAALNDEWLNPPAILIKKSIFKQNYKAPFAFQISTYLTQDWAQVIEIHTTEPISLISWQGTRAFFDKKQKTYLLEVKLKPDPFHYLNTIKDSVIRIISQKSLTIEVKIE